MRQPACVVPPRARIIALLAAVSGLTFATHALADRIKADNAATLNDPTSWLGGGAVVPGPTEMAIFDNHLAANSAFSLGDDAQSWLGLQLLNPANPISITAGHTLTLGAGGIDMSAATQSLTLNNNLSLIANQSWNVTTSLSVTAPINLGANVLSLLGPGNVTLASSISSAGGSLIKSGTGLLSLAAASTLSGFTQNAGTTLCSVPTALGSGSLTLLGGSLTMAFLNATLANRINVPGSITISHTSGSLSWTGAISGGGTINYNVSSTDYLSNNATQGTFTGTLNFGASTGFMYISGFDTHQLENASVDLGTASLNLGCLDGGIHPIASLSGGPATTLRAAGGAPNVPTNFIIGSNNASTTFAGTIMNGTGSGQVTAVLTKTGTGTLTLTGTASSYSGGLTISAGVLSISTVAALGAGSSVIPLGTSAAPATLRYTGPTGSTARLFTVNSQATIDSSGTGPLALSGTGAVAWGTANQPRTLTLTGSGSGVSTFSARINDNGALGPVSLIKSGPGTWQLTSALSGYSGGTTLNAGTLITTNLAGSTGNVGIGPLTINDTATFAGTGNTLGDITLHAGGHLSPGIPSLNTGVGTIIVHNISMDAGAFLDFDVLDSASSNDLISIVSAASLTLAGPVNVNLFQAGTSLPYSTPGTLTLFTGINASAGFSGAASNLHLNNPAGATSYAFSLSSAAGGASNILLTIAPGAGPITGTWMGAVSPGDWSASDHWQGGIPGAAHDSAVFGPSGSGGIINLNAARHLGALSLASGSSGNYTLSSGAGGKLFLDNGTGAAAISVTTGSHTIATDIELDSNAAISLAASTSLTLAGILNPPGSPANFSLSLSGPGKLILAAASAHKLADLSIASTTSGTNVTFTSTLNLTDNKLILEANDANDKLGKIASLNAAISSGAHGGTWTGTGITSSIAASDFAHYAVGVFDNGILGKTSFGGTSNIDPLSLFVTAAHLGDANGNAKVDIQDLTIIANNWQNSHNDWSHGDLNRDGVVDIQDYTIVANNWQQSSSLTLSGVAQPLYVPEPGALFALLFGSISLLLRRPKKNEKVIDDRCFWCRLIPV